MSRESQALQGSMCNSGCSRCYAAFEHDCALERSRAAMYNIMCKEIRRDLSFFFLKVHTCMLESTSQA